MPHKVCFISPEYWPLSGGTGAYVYYLSNELMKNGYRIHVVTGSNQTQDVKVNPQLDVSFLKIPKIPIVKSFMLAASKSKSTSKYRSAIRRTGGFKKLQKSAASSITTDARAKLKERLEAEFLALLSLRQPPAPQTDPANPQ